MNIHNTLKLIFLGLFFLTFGCGYPPYHGEEQVGAEELVMDSYKIKEGKISILEMCGITSSVLSPSLFEADPAFSGKVAILGLTSSEIEVDGKTQLYDVLVKAKVPVNANLFKSYIVRDKDILPVDLYKLVKQGDMSQNIYMHGGDKIYIAEPSAVNIMVLGEITKPKIVALPDGFMSVKQAIASAGGLLPTSDQRYIQVIRGNLKNPKIYTLHWQHIVRLPTDSLLLMPGDIVYVASAPITQWSRFVSQILPTIVGVEIVAHGAEDVGITVQ